MKITNRNTRKIALAVSLCISSSLAPQAAISMPAEMQGEAILDHVHGMRNLSTEDLVYLIGNKRDRSGIMHVSKMTDTDMQQTIGKSGAVGAITGAGIGAIGYTGYATGVTAGSAGSDSGSLLGLTASIIGGAVGGFISPALSAETAALGAFYAGLVSGAINGCGSCH